MAITIVEQYIIELLSKADCLIIAELGGFICHYQPAQIHPIRHSFMPATKRIVFNEKLKSADLSLAIAISKGERISLEQSKTMIEGYIFDFREQLKENNRFSIKGLGSFFINQEFRLQFDQTSTQNFNSGSFGLSELHFKPIIRENGSQKLIQTSRKQVFLDRKSKGMSWAVAAPLSVLILAVMGWVLVQQKAILFPKINIASLQISPKAEKNASNQKAAISLPIVENNADNTDNTEIETIESAKIENPNATKSVLREEKSTNKLKTINDKTTNVAVSHQYFLIAASFSNQKNANSLAEQLRQKGFEAQALAPPSSGGLYKVSLARYNNIEQAMELLKTQQQNFQERLWVYKANQTQE